MRRSACQEGDSHRRRDSGQADVSLTENRGAHVGVSGKPESGPPPTCCTPSSLLMASLSFLSSLADASESLILVLSELRQIESGAALIKPRYSSDNINR